MRFSVIVCIAVMLGLGGCASSSVTVGSDFSSENVSKIEKGVTTSDQLIALFGQPYSKTVLSASSEKWLYVYNHGQAKAVMFSVESTGLQKTLDVLIEDGIVANFAFTEKPLESLYSTQ